MNRKKYQLEWQCPECDGEVWWQSMWPRYMQAVDIYCKVDHCAEFKKHKRGRWVDASED